MAPDKSSAIDCILQTLAVQRFSANFDALHCLFTLCGAVAVDFPNLPIILSHVCRTWRDAALRTPWLWTVVRMQCKARESRHYAALRYLERSGSLPIHFYMSTARKLTPYELQVISPHQHRFREVIVFARTSSYSTGDDYPFSLRCWGDPTAHMPLLRRLDFRASTGTRMIFKKGQSTQDRDVMPLSSNMLWLQRNMNSLTCLSLANIPLDLRPSLKVLREVLVHNKRTLHHLEYQGATSWVSEDIPMIPFDLPVLRCLTLGYFSTDDLLPLVDAMNIPALQSLTLWDMCVCIEQGVSRSSAVLPALPGHLDGCRLLSRLKNTNTIRRLSLFGTSCSDGLAVATFTSTLLNLQMLTLYDCDQTFFDTICSSVPVPSSDIDDPQNRKDFPGKFLSQLTITHTPFATLECFLTKRIEVTKPLKRLTIDPTSFDDFPAVDPMEPRHQSMVETLQRVAEMVMLIPRHEVGEKVWMHEFPLMINRKLRWDTLALCRSGNILQVV